MSNEETVGLLSDPKTADFLKQFTFILERYYGRYPRLIWPGWSKKIESKVQLMDFELMDFAIQQIGWFKRFLRYPHGGILILNEEGRELATVGCSRTHYFLESVYQALRRLDSDLLQHVTYILLYENRPRVPLIEVSKLPKTRSLTQLLADYEDEVLTARK